jgi:uncharacterized protein
MTTYVAVDGVPFGLVPSEGSDWDVREARLATVAAPHSDIFVDPGGAGQVNAETLLNAATLLGDVPEGDFQFRTQVSVEFASTFDAGVLLLWLDERHWAKLCFEFSPDREPWVVSVVNRDVADDANAFVVEGGSMWLRISRLDQVYAFHASLDGQRWRLIRAFVLSAPGTSTRLGFEAQSPTGDGCAVTFQGIAFEQRRLTDLRDGS